MTGQVRIEPMQAAALIISGILGKVFIAFPGALSREAGPAGWLVITLAALFTLPALLAIIALSSRFPSRSLPEVFDHVMGRPLGLALTLIISGSFLAVGSLVTREFAESNKVGILPETPLSALIFVMLLMIVIAGSAGLEVMGRASVLFFPTIALVFLTLVAGNAKDFTPTGLLPLLGPGPGKLLMIGIQKTSIYGEIIILAVLYPHLRNQRQVRRLGLAVLGACWFGFTLTQVALELILAWPASARFTFPLLEMARQVSPGPFFERVEAVFIFFWFYFLAVKLSVVFWAATMLLAQALHLQDYRRLLLPMGIILYTMAFIPPSMSRAVILDNEVVRVYGGIIFYGVPALVLLAARIRGKDDRARERTA